MCLRCTRFLGLTLRMDRILKSITGIHRLTQGTVLSNHIVYILSWRVPIFIQTEYYIFKKYRYIIILDRLVSGGTVDRKTAYNSILKRIRKRNPH